MKYNNEWLIKELAKGMKARYIFFWGHTAAKDDAINKACFSQWYPAAFTVDGVEYATAEHWMMAEKARLFGDEETAKKIIAGNQAGDAKKLGRLIRNFDAATWDKHKVEIVVRGNYHKFSQHVPLKEYLLQTGNCILAEASPADAIWGTGMAADHADIMHPDKWRGENLLGYALMEVRDRVM